MIIVLSIVFGLVPLAAIGFIAKDGSFTTVDGLFTTLILLALAGILFLNAGLGIRKKLRPKDSNHDNKDPQLQKAV